MARGGLRIVAARVLRAHALSARGQVDAAAKVIRELLTPKEDSENVSIRTVTILASNIGVALLSPMLELYSSFCGNSPMEVISLSEGMLAAPVNTMFRISATNSRSRIKNTS